jgi:transcriptional regulator with XRE-family HTH domain
MKTPVPNNATPRSWRRPATPAPGPRPDAGRFVAHRRRLQIHVIPNRKGKANPTIAITWRLANALGVQIGELLATAERETKPSAWSTRTKPHPARPARGLRAAHPGPLELASKYEWYELTLSPGGELASQGHDPGAQEHLTLLHGSVEVEVGNDKKKVKLGSALPGISSTLSAMSARRKRKRCW